MELRKLRPQTQIVSPLKELCEFARDDDWPKIGGRAGRTPTDLLCVVSSRVVASHDARVQ